MEKAKGGYVYNEGVKSVVALTIFCGALSFPLATYPFANLF